MVKYDLFISHASEDKEALVQPLATALAAFGVRVWYDEFTLEAGDSLSRSIDRGLADSRFGVVVLSPSFILKPWPEYELRGLVSKELGRDKVIIPLWFGVSRDDVLGFSPPLADKLAIVIDLASMDEVAAEILRVVRPDRHAQLRRLLLSKQLTCSLSKVKTKRIAHGFTRHSKFPKMLLSRINLIRHVFLSLMPETFEEAVDAFRRDTHPEQEIVLWEAMAATYLDFVYERAPSIVKQKVALDVLLHLATQPLPAKPLRRWAALDADDLAVLRARWEIFGSHVPATLVTLKKDT